ncbi:hypothetical protein ACOSP7_016531 [Xanthoceras sorbifolium]
MEVSPWIYRVHGGIHRGFPARNFVVLHGGGGKLSGDRRSSKNRSKNQTKEQIEEPDQRTDRRTTKLVLRLTKNPETSGFFVDRRTQKLLGSSSIEEPRVLRMTKNPEVSGFFIDRRFMQIFFFMVFLAKNSFKFFFF